jgi:hypothetical protein
VIDALERALDELVPRYKEPRRWDEVVQRASVRLHRRRVLTLAFAAGLAAVLIGAGGVFHREFVDFFSADPAPEPIRIDFAKMGARTNIMVGPGHDMAEAREVTRFPADGELRPLWAAPMKTVATATAGTRSEAAVGCRTRATPSSSASAARRARTG